MPEGTLPPLKLPPLRGPLATAAQRAMPPRPGTSGESLPPDAPDNAEALKKLREGKFKRPLFRLEQQFLPLTGYSPTIDPDNKQMMVDWLNKTYGGAEFRGRHGQVVTDIQEKMNDLKKKIKELFKIKFTYSHAEIFIFNGAGEGGFEFHSVFENSDKKSP